MKTLLLTSLVASISMIGLTTTTFAATDHCPALLKAANSIYADVNIPAFFSGKAPLTTAGHDTFDVTINKQVCTSPQGMPMFPCKTVSTILRTTMTCSYDATSGISKISGKLLYGSRNLDIDSSRSNISADNILTVYTQELIPLDFTANLDQ